MLLRFLIIPTGLDREGERLFRFHQRGGLRYLLNAAKLKASGLPKPTRLKRGNTPRPPAHELSFVNSHTFCHTYGTWSAAGNPNNPSPVMGMWSRGEDARRCCRHSRPY